MVSRTREEQKTAPRRYRSRSSEFAREAETYVGLVEEILASGKNLSPEAATLVAAVERKLRTKEMLMASEMRKLEQIYGFACR
jgi:hypothetical protein